MALLKPKEERKPNRRPYTNLTCVAARHRTKKCFRLCKPISGRGACGRVAPHSLKTRRQIAIAKYLREHGRPGAVVEE